MSHGVIPADGKYAMGPRWALVTVTFNSSAKLRKHWSDVVIPEEVEWIVVDNGSADDSANVASEFGARVVALEENCGFGAANNIGFARSTAPYVAFVNPDVTPNVQDLALLERFLSDSPTALVAPQLLNSDGSFQPNGRGTPYLASKVLHRLNPGAQEGTYRRYAGSGEVTQVVWLTGAVVAGRRDRLSCLGPWDERFFVYYEDSDLGLRNKVAGGDSFVLGDATWLHGWARETSGLNVRAWRLELASLVKFYVRYPSLLFPFRAQGTI